MARTRTPKAKTPNAATDQRALDQFYATLERAPSTIDDATRDRFVGKAGPAGEIIMWTDGHRAVVVPGAPETILAAKGWAAVSDSTRPGWMVPADLAPMLKRAKVFAADTPSGRLGASRRMLAGRVEVAGDRLWLRAGDVDHCAEWAPLAGDSADGVLTVDIRYLEPIAALAAAGFAIVAHWTPDADEPIAFALPTGARYIVQPIQMKRATAVPAEESVAA